MPSQTSPAAAAAATAGPAHRVSSAVEVYGFPQGHIGHMTPDEEAALNGFKELCAKEGLYKPSDDADEYGTHDDATLLRFLRARRFNIQDALKQFKHTEEWREANQLDTLYETIDLGQYDETRRLYPQWTGRRDKRGIPVYVYEVKHLNSKAMSAYEKSATHTKTKAKTDDKTPAKLLRLFALYENLRRFVLPLSTILTDRDYPETPITQTNNIVDISGVGLMQFWNLRSHMQDASVLATAHYPETLDRIFIIGAPAFFPTVWGWIKRWFDPITTSKMFILSNHEMQTTLRKFIDPENIPKKYGGKLDFQFGDLPVLDPALKDIITWHGEHRDFPPGPAYWKDKGDHFELVAVGSVDHTERHEIVCTTPKPLRNQVIDEKVNGVPKTSEARPESLIAPITEDPVLLVEEGIELSLGNDDRRVTDHPGVAETGSEVRSEVIPTPAYQPMSLVTSTGNLEPPSRNENDESMPVENGVVPGLSMTSGSGLGDPKVSRVAVAVAETGDEQTHEIV